MFKLCFFVVTLLIIHGVALGAFLSDGVKEFHFMKTDDGSNEYDFKWVEEI